jgi:hypothetical protein
VPNIDREWRRVMKPIAPETVAERIEQLELLAGYDHRPFADFVLARLAGRD